MGNSNDYDTQIQMLIDVGNQWEQFLTDAYRQAGKKFKPGSAEYNQALGYYVDAMQNVQDTYVNAFHIVTQEIANSFDLKSIADATKQLQDSLDRLQAIEKWIVVALKILTVGAMVTTALLDPTKVTAPAAVGGVMDLVASIAAAAQSPPPSVST